MPSLRVVQYYGYLPQVCHNEQPCLGANVLHSDRVQCFRHYLQGRLKQFSLFREVHILDPVQQGDEKQGVCASLLLMLSYSALLDVCDFSFTQALEYQAKLLVHPINSSSLSACSSGCQSHSPWSLIIAVKRCCGKRTKQPVQVGNRSNH